jgi:energy-coupling factor transport system ATP-binding protein
MALLEVKDLSFSYPKATAPALSDVSFALRRGEFAALCGVSGCGKTTLLRHLKTALAPTGMRSGSVLLGGQPLDQVPALEQAQAVGFVLQNPDNQIVTDKVWHELAFGLESLGFSQEVIRLRTAEMASFFGIQTWYHKKIIELSGGQKQLLNLAAIMAMQPELLILDEPTSQLDPIAAAEFLATVKKVNGELGVTVLLSEHRLEDALPLADRVAVMSAGRLVAFGSAEEIGRQLKANADPMLYAMPTPMRAALAIGVDASRGGIPISVREGRQWLEKSLSSSVSSAEAPTALEGASRDEEAVVGQKRAPREKAAARDAKAVISTRELWFRYEREGEDVLRGLSLKVDAGEFLAIVGGNGTGKSTALGVLSGRLKAYRGKLKVAGLDPSRPKAATLAASGLVVLPQDPQTLFVHNSILEDLMAAVPAGQSPEERDERLRAVIEDTEIAGILTRHPYDVSGGEQQRAALAIALLAEPSILLLDEPTKGMDAFFKRKFARILERLRAGGMTLVMVSHDVEFCAAYADRCALFFDGAIVTEGDPRSFFSGNSFYTTAANRMSRGLIEGVVTTEDLIAALNRRETRNFGGQ